ncbi:PREDICTED: huntingtin-like, partial [Capra hircus]|uniref:huntingtin-like n=1 Tax=Capra hircus TaxID=9925 RepID=UPI000847600D
CPSTRCGWGTASRPCERRSGTRRRRRPRPGTVVPAHVALNSRKHRAGVDIHSCSQFLLELYSRWILPSSSARRTPVTLISEVVRSLLVVSDLFTERNQFEMMYLTLTELRKAHPSEDEILLQYLVPATCKAAAVLGW